MKRISLTILSILIAGCAQQTDVKEAEKPAIPSFYGTLEPMASDAVYFLMTDRFVDGDPTNNYPEQGGDNPTWMGKMDSGDGRSAYVGYMGGDFKGVLNNAGYISELGFGAIWLTPIVDNPDESFAGGEPITFNGGYKDGGKSGYHGYWGVNFFELDEHLPSEGLDYAELNKQLEQKHGLKTILDVVVNHGSPSFTMPVDQPKYGEIYNQDGKLVADHMNLEPTELDPTNPLHKMFNTKRDLAQLSDMNPDEPAVMEYFIAAYEHWLGQGVDAFRIDTVKHMPIEFWERFAARIRKNHPDLFMFAEVFDHNPEFLGKYTLNENGRISVLDFALKQAFIDNFQSADGDLREIEKMLFLTEGPYQNPYELMTFYDNHDMRRIDTDAKGYINAHNLLFTTRGIPVLYYGSEIGYMTGTGEHEGNRNYFGQERIDSAPESDIYQSLKKISKLRQQSVSLQRGLQINLDFQQHTAAFLRVYEHEEVFQTALVLINKSDDAVDVHLADELSSGLWTEGLTNQKRSITKGSQHKFNLAPNSVQVWLLNEMNTHPALIEKLKIAMAAGEYGKQ